MQVVWQMHPLHVLVESLPEGEAAQVMRKIHVETLVEVLPKGQVAELRRQLDML